MRKKSFIVITVMLAIIAVFVGFRIYLHVNSAQKEELKETVLTNGPWARQSIWNTSDGHAYLISQKTDNEKINAVTAYFYIDETWCRFEVNITYSNTLLFVDESDAEQFTGEFNIRNNTFIVKDIKGTEENDSIPFDATYIFSEAINYDEEISKLPFDR